LVRYKNVRRRWFFGMPGPDNSSGTFIVCS
jgi:hypothetical protein